MQCADEGALREVHHESPAYVRLSLAAAMTLGFVPGWFHRNAKLRCVNLLLTYEDGCKASCAFCGLAREKDATWTAKKFIRVPWKTFPTPDVVQAIKRGPSHVGRVCISMITHPRCRDDVLAVCKQVAQVTGLPVSLLISPSIITREDLLAMKEAGADRIGVAIDGATPEIFDRFRGKPVNGPHRWDRYWQIYEESIRVFGRGMAGAHLICGLGETEREMVGAIYRARALGGSTHLFSFFPEKGSALESQAPPPIGNYRRIQLARWLIDHDLTVPDRMAFSGSGRILDFGVTAAQLDEAILCREPFETSGCPGPDGKTACNRPYGNEKPGADIRNFPFPPDDEDLEGIIRELSE